jgi:hypothetical protein
LKSLQFYVSSSNGAKQSFCALGEGGEDYQLIQFPSTFLCNFFNPGPRAENHKNKKKEKKSSILLKAIFKHFVTLFAASFPLPPTRIGGGNEAINRNPMSPRMDKVFFPYLYGALKHFPCRYRRTTD